MPTTMKVAGLKDWCKVSDLEKYLDAPGCVQVFLWLVDRYFFKSVCMTVAGLGIIFCAKLSGRGSPER